MGRSLQLNAAPGLPDDADCVGRRAVPSESEVIQHPPGAEEFTATLGQLWLQDYYIFMGSQLSR